jgi:hypothetical protein
MKSVIDATEYCVIEVREYYAGDCQHPTGWEIVVEEDKEHLLVTGTRGECETWAEEHVNNCLGHNMAGRRYRVVEVVDRSADYQFWLDQVDWEGCPGGDDDYTDNCAWAEQRALDTDGILPVVNRADGQLWLINLTIEDCD